MDPFDTSVAGPNEVDTGSEAVERDLAIGLGTKN
jgi:hypothetical protein